eukprot:scaffold13.g341.t1
MLAKSIGARPASGVASPRSALAARRAGGAALAVHASAQGEAAPGEHVRVVGGHRRLGDWDIGRAPKLEELSSSSHNWSGTVDGFTVGAPFQFKFILLPDGPASARNVVWEDIPDRFFQPGGEQTIQAKWNEEGFEASAPRSVGSCQLETLPRGSNVDAEIKGRLDATLARLSAGAKAK